MHELAMGNFLEGFGERGCNLVPGTTHLEILMENIKNLLQEMVTEYKFRQCTF
jgi:hypothetical protein